MAADFTVLDKFNSEKSFVQVEFGNNTKLLEVELNEMQKIQMDALASMFRNQMHSGVLSLPAPIFSTATPNGFILPGFEAMINGYKVKIRNAGGKTDGTNLITLPAPDLTGSREDLVFLEMWFEEIDSTEVVKQYGNAADGAVITNDLKDPRVGIETSRRIQLRWRIRTQPATNFTTYPEGVNDIVNVKAQGGNIANTTLTYAIDLVDKGLYKSGSGSAGDKSTLLTYDGYSYAIPLFRVKRRNSGGFSVGNFGGGRGYSPLTVTNGIVNGQTNYIANISSSTPIGSNYNVGDMLVNTMGTSLGIITVINTVSNPQTITIGQTIGTLGGGGTIVAKSDRPDSLYANVIDSRDIPPSYDLRHKSHGQYNYDYELKKASDQFMRGELSPKKMLKTYHGIPKTEIDANTVFYASLDGTTVAEVGGAPTLTSGTISYKPAITGSGATGQALKYNLAISSNSYTVDFIINKKPPELSGTYLLDLVDVNIFLRTRAGQTNELVFKVGLDECPLSNDNKNYPKHIRFIVKDNNTVSIYDNGVIKYSGITLPFVLPSAIMLNGFRDSPYYLGHGIISDISISNIDRGSIFPNLPPDFISGDAQIMPAYTEQRKLYSQAQMAQTVNGIAKIANASGTSRGLYTDRMSGNWSAPTAQVETATVVGTVTGDGNASVVITSSGMTGSPKTVAVAVSSGVAQVETATVVGTITTEGNASVVVTANGMTGSPKTIPVAVALSDDASAIAGKIRTALGLDADVIAKFTISGATDKIILTSITKVANDATLNIAVADGTCVGITAAPTSADTTAGVASDNASAVAGKIRTALGLDATISGKFTIGGATDKVILTAKVIAINDGTLNISVDNGTCTGLTTALTSANTTYGTLGTITVTGMAGELISGVFDTDTALCTVIKDALSTDTVIYTDLVTGLVAGDEVKLVDRVLGTVLATKTIATGGVDETLKKVTFTATLGVALSKYQVVVMESTASSSVPLAYHMVAGVKTAVVGTWATLGTNVAIFTLGTNAGLLAQDIQIDYSLIIPSGQPALSVPCTATLGGEAGFRIPVANQTITSDYAGKIMGQTWENPNVYKVGLDNPTTLLTPDQFLVNYERDTPDYTMISTQDGVVNSWSATDNGAIAQVLLSFDLIKIAERKLGCKIPAKDVAGKVAWLKSNCAISFYAWSFGSSPNGNKMYLGAWRTNLWLASWYTNTSNAPVKTGGSINFSYINDDGFCRFLAYADPSDGTTPSTINVDYASLVIKFADKVVNGYKLVNGTLAVRDDFVGKVSGSLVECGNVIKNTSANNLVAPTGVWAEYTTSYPNMFVLDNVLTSKPTSVSGEYAQQLFSFNLIRIVEDKYGPIPALDKVQWLKDNLLDIRTSWWGYGSGPLGNKAELRRWDGSTWLSASIVNSTSSVTKLLSVIGVVASAIDSNGFAHFIAYADPSDGTTASTIYTDYCSIELTFKPLTEYDQLVPENPRRDAGMSAILSVRKETKEVQMMFPKLTEASLVTYEDFLEAPTAISANTGVTILAEIPEFLVTDLGSAVGYKQGTHHWMNPAYRVGQDRDELYGEIGFSSVPFVPDSVGVNVGARVTVNSSGFTMNFCSQWGIKTVAKPLVVIGRWMVLVSGELKMLVACKYTGDGNFSTYTSSGEIGYLISLNGKPLSKELDGFVRSYLNPTAWKTSPLVVQGFIDKATNKLITTNNSI